MDAPPPVALIIGAIILVAIFVAVFMYIQGGQAASPSGPSGPSGPAGPTRRSDAEVADEAMNNAGGTLLNIIVRKYW
jgi:hypothetical protein